MYLFWVHKCIHTDKYGNMLYPDDVLITVKNLNVKCWTLLILNGRHLGYIVEGTGPSSYDNGSWGYSGCCKLSFISPQQSTKICFWTNLMREISSPLAESSLIRFTRPNLKVCPDYRKARGHYCTSAVATAFPALLQACGGDVSAGLRHKGPFNAACTFLTYSFYIIIFCELWPGLFILRPAGAIIPDGPKEGGLRCCDCYGEYCTIQKCLFVYF